MIDAIAFFDRAGRALRGDKEKKTGILYPFFSLYQLVTYFFMRIYIFNCFSLLVVVSKQSSKRNHRQVKTCY